MSVFKRGTGKLEMTDAERIERLYSKVVKLQAENERLKGDMQRIYNNCSDTDLIIDIAGAALEVSDDRV